MYGEVLDEGAGPALGYAENTVGVAGDQAQRGVEFGIGDELLPPFIEVGDTTTALILGHAQYGVNRWRQRVTVMVQYGPGRPLWRGQAGSEVAAQQLVIRRHRLQTLLRHGLRSHHQAFGQFGG